MSKLLQRFFSKSLCVYIIVKVDNILMQTIFGTSKQIHNTYGSFMGQVLSLFYNIVIYYNSVTHKNVHSSLEYIYCNLHIKCLLQMGNDIILFKLKEESKIKKK